MKRPGSIYVGTVMHKRLRPVRHEFRYSVFTLLLDVDRLDAIAKGLRLFSVDRGNFFSVHRRDHGEGNGDLRGHLDVLAERAVGPGRVVTWMMLAYPRILGFVFNPLTVYYGLDLDGKPAAVVYEVSNTFGERHSYVIAVEGKGNAIRQAADKRFYVSPFNPVAGRYRFRTRLPRDTAFMSILLEDDDSPMFSAGFTGEYRPLTDRVLAVLFLRHFMMTFKIWTGIHFEAARLWFKGVKIHPRPGAKKEGRAHDRPRRLIIRPIARK